ncbi:MAG: amidohydrolase [Acidobacteria bacterium]|nr:MAG: amidohydrolase [Acidobacteriota bacterium]
MKPSSRREFLGRLAAFGASGFIPRGGFAAQTDATHPRRINVHHHLTAPAYVKFLTDNKVRDFPNKSVAEGVEDMDKGGIATAFTSIIGPGIWFGNIADTRRLARECNEFAAKLVRDHPGRFGMFASLPLPDIDGSLREMEYALDTLKADGIYLFTNFGQTPLYGDKYLGDPALAPIYEELNRRRVIVYTHPKDNYCCREVVPGVNGPTIEYGTDTTRAIASLLYSGTAAKYPDVTFIFSHGGGTMPYLASRFLGGIAPYLQDGGVLKAGAPAEASRPTMPKGMLYELQKFYYDTAQAENPLSLGALRKLVPLRQLLFGTDFPFGAGAAEHVKNLQVCGVFNAQELRAIERDNAIRLLPRLRS